MKRLLTLIYAILLLVSASIAGERQDSVVVSLVTCWPGSEVYELCGHEAIRVRGVDRFGTPVDSVWNYGTFDFAQPNFVYRFVKGETDYMLSSYSFSLFMQEYMMFGRHVEEQDLNLTPAEASKLLSLLRTEALPANRVYRYNYVKDNCATRILDRLDQVASSRIIYPDSITYGSFRREMRAYHRDYPWYQFGIDLALGSGIDIPITGRQEMFVPLEMMKKVDGAHFADGRPLVAQHRIVFDGLPDATLGPTPWIATPLTLSLSLLVVIALLSWLQWRRKRVWRWLYSLIFSVIGLAGCVVTFLVFFSSHEATSPNMLLIWLNPLQLIFAASIWSGRRLRWLSLAIAYYNIIALLVSGIVWPFQQQCANPAFFPLMVLTMIMAITYALIPRAEGYNYKKNKSAKSPAYEETRSLGVVGGGSSVARRSRRSGATTSRGRYRR